MSSTTKYPLIDKNSIKESEELETTEQLYRSLSDYERMVKDENDSKKTMIANEIARMGEQFIDEIDTKEKLKEDERLDMIEYIISTTEQKLVKVRDLNNMNHEEVKPYYLKAQDQSKPWYRLFIEFLMGW
jgi:hypothetical protein